MSNCEQKLEDIRQSSIRLEEKNNRILNALNELIRLLGGVQK